MKRICDLRAFRLYFRKRAHGKNKQKIELKWRKPQVFLLRKWNLLRFYTKHFSFLFVCAYACMRPHLLITTYLFYHTFFVLSTRFPSFCTISAFFTNGICKLCIVYQLRFAKKTVIIRVQTRKEGTVQWQVKQPHSLERSPKVGYEKQDFEHGGVTLKIDREASEIKNPRVSVQREPTNPHECRSGRSEIHSHSLLRSKNSRPFTHRRT